MNILALTLAAAVIIYLCRWSGFALNPASASPFWSAFLRYVPIAIFTALVVTPLTKNTGTLGPQVAALATAGLVARRTRQPGLSVLVGLGVLWAVSAVGSAIG
jgi:branched-subunit amino acid transport protein